MRIWIINETTAGNSNLKTYSYTTHAIYSKGELYKTVTYDEHSKQVVEFKDKEGKVILKKVQLTDSVSNGHNGWLCTYHIYDKKNNLQLVMPPKAVELSHAQNWDST